MDRKQPPSVQHLRLNMTLSLSEIPDERCLDGLIKNSLNSFVVQRDG